jgi:hypothetical protein
MTIMEERISKIKAYTPYMRGEKIHCQAVQEVDLSQTNYEEAM